jgi:hypothetical protein
MQYLYRNFRRVTIAATAVTLLLSAFAAAQIRDRTHQNEPPPDPNASKPETKKPKNYPRAIGVVEFLPGGKAQLVPVALWIDDHFYDASLYGANPEPMAVQPETVYEATDYGEPVGLFTVITPEQVKGSWIATGMWKPHSAMDEKMAKQAAKQPKPKPVDDFDSGRPTLHRAGGSGSSDSSGSASSTAGAGSPSGGGTPAAAEDDPNRPILKKPAQSTDDSSPSQSAGASPASTQTSSSATSSSTPATNSASNPPPVSDENDPNRPVLRHGKPTGNSAAPQSNAAQSNAPQSGGTPASNQAAMQAAQAKSVATTATAGRKSFPAISDAGAAEPKSMLYSMNPTERASKSDQLGALATNEIRKFIASRHTPALPKSATIQDFDLRVYDLDYTNSPTLVYTATLPVVGAKAFRGGEFDYFVTFVAREDIDGAPIKIFSSVTDSNHLDAFPRMETIGAVNADVKGRGDLMFRQYSDTGVNYSLYRVFPYDMQKIFEGGSGV